MKRFLVLLAVALLAVSGLAACGGGAAAPAPEPAAVVEEAADAPAEEPADTSAPVEEPAVAPTEVPVEEAAPTDAPADAAAPTEAPAEAAAPDAAASPYGDLLLTGTDPETGLEINPATTAPGTDYVIRGKISSFNLIPQESPEFLIEGPNGVRYRVQTQAVPNIFLADGTQLAPHQIVRGLPIQATARLTESTRATSVMISENFVILSAEPVK